VYECVIYIYIKNLAFQHKGEFEVLLTVQFGIILANEQLETKFFYFIIRLLQSSTCFEQRSAHHQEVKLYSCSIWYRHCK